MVVGETVQLMPIGAPEQEREMIPWKLSVGMSWSGNYADSPECTESQLVIAEIENEKGFTLIAKEGI